MSTLAYAQLTTAREEAPPGASSSTSKPGVNTYVDALAALVPAEILTLHGLILTATTSVESGVTKITAQPTLFWSFWALLIAAGALYYLSKKDWDALDNYRMLIPPLAFVGWTMLQRATAFDAVANINQAPRTVIALFLAAALGVAAVKLAYKADQKS